MSNGDKLRLLYDAGSKHFDLGDYDSFVLKMGDENKRSVLYNSLSEHYDLGSFQEFNNKIEPTISQGESKFIGLQKVDIGTPPQYTISKAEPKGKKVGVYATEHSKPIAGMPNGMEKTLLYQKGGIEKLREHGYEVVLPTKNYTPTSKDIGKFQARRFLQKEIEKELAENPNKSYRESYRDVVASVGAKPPDVVDLAFNKSITGTVFRLFGQDQNVDVSQYPETQLEQIVSGAISMVMPIDALIFKGGGAVGVKGGGRVIAKYGDDIVNVLVKRGGLSKDRAIEVTKKGIQRLAGSAGGFGAFDLTTDVTMQLEQTGTVDPLHATKSLLLGTAKGLITAGAGGVAKVGGKGVAGKVTQKEGSIKMAGEVSDFVGTILGLGSAPLLEGDRVEWQDYINAGGMIIGIKLLHAIPKARQKGVVENVAKEVESNVKKGMTFQEAVQSVYNEVRSSMELALMVSEQLRTEAKDKPLSKDVSETSKKRAEEKPVEARPEIPTEPKPEVKPIVEEPPKEIRPAGEVVTDPVEVQKIKNGIQEGELILKSGKKINGEPYEAGALESIRNHIIDQKKKIGDTSETPLPKILKKKKSIEIGKVYTKQEMIDVGAGGSLSKAKVMEIPIKDIDGLEPVPEPKSYVKGREITQPIEVVYEKDMGKYMLYAGNHRVQQAKINGQESITAFVEGYEKTGKPKQEAPKKPVTQVEPTPVSPEITPEAPVEAPTKAGIQTLSTDWVMKNVNRQVEEIPKPTTEEPNKGAAWRQFTKEIEKEGIKEPIEIVKTDKGWFLSDGLHRLLSANEIGIKDLKVNVVISKKTQKVPQKYPIGTFVYGVANPTKHNPEGRAKISFFNEFNGLYTLEEAGSKIPKENKYLTKEGFTVPADARKEGVKRYNDDLNRLPEKERKQARKDATAFNKAVERGEYDHLFIGENDQWIIRSAYQGGTDAFYREIKEQIGMRFDIDTSLPTGRAKALPLMNEYLKKVERGEEKSFAEEYFEKEEKELAEFLEPIEEVKKEFKQEIDKFDKNDRGYIEEDIKLQSSGELFNFFDKLAEEGKKDVSKKQIGTKQDKEVLPDVESGKAKAVPKAGERGGGEKVGGGTQDLIGEKAHISKKLNSRKANLEETKTALQQELKKKGLLPRVKQKHESAIERIDQILAETQREAKETGVELYSFFGVPNPKEVKRLFGKAFKPKKLNPKEIDELYKVATGKKEPTTKVGSALGRSRLVRGKYSPIEMVDRVKMMKTPTSKKASEMMRETIDLQKKVHGQISQELDIALKSVGSGKPAKSLGEFTTIRVDGKDVKVSRLHAVVEGHIKPRDSKEAEVVEKIRDLIEKRGLIFEEYGIKQLSPEGEVKPFKVIGREIAPRIMSPQFYSIIESGQSHPNWNHLVNAFSKATGTKKSVINKYFTDFRSSLIGDMPDKSVRPVQAEFSREWKHIPHAIEVKGDFIPIVEYRPYEYVSRLAETGEARVGVAKIFGQEVDKTSVINKMKTSISEEGGDPMVFHEAMRSLSGASLEPPKNVDVGVVWGNSVRASRTFLNTMKQASLTVSVVPNIPEVLGNVRQFGGTANMMKGIWKQVRHPKATTLALEQMGSITIDIANLSVDPNRPISSRIRAINEASRRVFLHKHINEFQEKLSAVVADMKVEGWKRGQKRGTDEILVRAMGFSPEVAKKIVNGEATDSQYNAVIRRAPAFLTGGAQRKAEYSRFENNRIARSAIPFQTYAQMKIRHLGKVLNQSEKFIEEGVKEKDWKKLNSAGKVVASEFIGTAMAGMSAQMLLAMAYGGKDELEIKWNEVKADPLRFVIHSWAYTQFGGPYGAIIQSTSGGRDPLEAIYPYTVGKELLEATTGEGKYTYDDFSERLWRFVERFAPINRVTKNIAVAVGFGNEEAHKTDVAIKGYWRWRFKNKYVSKYSSVPDEEIKTFRSNMKRAYNAIRLGEEPKVIRQFMIDAVGSSGKDTKSISASIRGKMLLGKSKLAPSKSDEEYAKRLRDLEKTIGKTAYKRLVDHDRLLEEFAKAIN